MIPVELARLIISERSEDQVIYLRQLGSPREFPIVIGSFEAFAIDRLVREEVSERPLTHDLLAGAIAQLGGRVTRCVVDDIKGGTFYAKVVLASDAGEVMLDARPSDAITLALKVQAPLYVSEKVMRNAAS
ncbi:bifunctional nuclease family protein [Planctomycetota bacterium]|nr:bifunctional nuclease family protein [Planctomycetota bacterium]